MLTENLLTATLKKRKAAFLLFIAAALFFSVFAFLENPLKSTISDIGRTRLPLLAVYCIILPLCDIINVEYMLRAFKLKAPVLRALFLASNICVGFVVTTLMPELPEKTVTTFSVLLHWLTGFGNIVLNATVVLILCLRLSKRESSKKGKALFVSGTALCVADLVFFVVMSIVMGGVKEGKNGLYEIIPIVATHVVLFAVNHTNLFSAKADRDREEASIKAQDTSVFAAVSYFFLAAAWLFFTFYAFVRNPVFYTISMTGLDYPLGFGVTSFLISISLSLNFILAFKRSGYKNVLAYILGVGGSLTLLVCVFMPTTHSGTTLDPVHSTAAVLFFIFIMLAVILFCFFKRRENKTYLPLAVSMLVILALTLAVAYIMNILLDQKYGRTGLVEVVPLQFIFFFLFFENFTDVLKRKAPVAGSADKKQITA
ncbi:MAG: Frag1/DRAM/Sfk1 family protein [Oscillospiraceae bacterium]|nr:Frag1/DRAM/Sfk1 family protein [Oscillospiraceae bacterium]